MFMSSTEMKRTFIFLSCEEALGRAVARSREAGASFRICRFITVLLGILTLKAVVNLMKIKDKGERRKAKVKGREKRRWGETERVNGRNGEHVNTQPDILADIDIIHFV